jgi:hypothetical protein
VPAQSATPTFWRIFYGTSCALVGALVVLHLEQGIIQLPAMLGGALLGATFGVVTFFQAEAYEIPSSEVVRLGTLLGAAEGLLAGAVFGAAPGAILGLLLGSIYGQAITAYSWRVRQRAGRYMLALLVGAIIEALGGLGIGVLMNLIWQKGFGVVVFPVALMAGLALQSIANRRS